MPSMSSALALRELVESDVAWRLLRADNAPIIIALLSEHLGGEERRLAADDLYERLDHDLDALRAHGLDLPLSAQGYCADWRKVGFLTRRPADQARGETLELSPGALSAIHTVEQLVAPRQTVTESRLASIADQLRRLAVDTDPDATRRLAELHAQRDRIDEQIERINSGDIVTLEADRALERVRDILAQAAELPSDFARVRARFEDLNRDLRSRIVESDEGQRAVLDEVFRGVDLIQESDEGRTFAGFSSLVLDPVVGTAFDDDLARVLSREFADELSRDDQRFLRRFIGSLKEHSGEIHDVITAFARGLRRYVQSQDYQRDRVLRQLLRDSQAAGVAASAHVKPYQQTDLSLALSAVALSSAGAIRLHDPADFDARAPITVHEQQPVDLEALRALARETEIDFAELTANVNDLLAIRTHCTVADVLELHPATQGVASVVGLLSLAANQGVRGDGVETVRWNGPRGRRRSALVHEYRFTGRVL